MPKLFAKRLSVVMVEYKLTQKKIAVMGKTSQATVSNVMNGICPTLNFLNNFYRSFSDEYGDVVLEKHFKLRSVVKPHLMGESQVLELLSSFTSPNSKLLSQVHQHYKSLSKEAIDEILTIIQRELD